MNDRNLDKFQLATVRLAGAIFDFFARSHPVNIVDDIRAARELVKGVSALYSGKELIDPIHYDDNENTLIQIIRITSNFSKHAHKDARRMAPYSDDVCVFGLSQAVREYLELFDALEDRGYLDYFGKNTPLMVRGLAAVFQNWFDQDYSELQAVAQELSYRNLKALTETFTSEASSPAEVIRRLKQIEFSLGVSRGVIENSAEFVQMKEAHSQVFQLILNDDGLWPLPYNGGVALKRIPEIDFKAIAPEPSTYLR